ncbi:MAG: nucleoside triphosphate pyrophosphohydrolase [Lentisphaeria bacterium]|nr:nucleoside triphosphate pyrophosphohydrolase [Lentisphaeria bacterium]
MNQENMQKLVDIMKALRAPDGCPWDKVQTHKSLKKCSMEECAELMDAIEEENDAGMCEELGDLLMHVVLHSVIAEERGVFSFDDVVQGISAKMIRRHPHVFGDEKVKDTSDVLKLWEAVKKQEHKDDRKSLMDGIPYHCPALLQAEKMQKKAAKVGFDWSTQEQILEKIGEEFAEVKVAIAEGNEEHIDEELGDFLFAVTNLVRFRKRNSSEDLLAAANRKFVKRFRYIEEKLAEQGKDIEAVSLEEMDSLWNEAKKKGIK